MGRRFLNAGKNVLIEYPLALSYAEAQELFQIAEQKGRLLLFLL